MVDDYIEIPKELISTQQEVTLCMDGMKVDGLAFLTTVSRNLQYRTAQFVKHQTPGVYCEVLQEIFRVYNTGGFQVTTIRCDNEFRPLIEPLANEFNVDMNFANVQGHVPEAERNNRVIKDRVRATYRRLPYRHLTRTMAKVLVSDSAKKLNFFPANTNNGQSVGIRLSKEAELLFSKAWSVQVLQSKNDLTPEEFGLYATLPVRHGDLCPSS